MVLTVTPMSPVLGAEIRGVDLTGEIDDATFAAIRQAFHDHSVIVFRDQATPMTPEVQVTFARRFGDLHRHPAAPLEGAEGAIFVIHAHRDSKVANGNGWHSDVSSEAEPPAATMLQLHLLPEGGGGDTLFSSLEAAYAVLSAESQERLRGLSALHTSEHIYRGRYEERGVDDQGKAYPEHVHPLVRTHPETGRPCLFINRAFTTAIDGLEPAESKELLRRLLNHVERPEFQVRLRWEQNDVAMWDNRCLQHYALWDYWPDERKGNRVTIVGDRPYFDPSAPAPPPSSIRMRAPSFAAG